MPHQLPRSARFAALAAFALATSCQSTDSLQLRSVGAEVQAYPAGVITTARAAWSE